MNIFIASIAILFFMPTPSIANEMSAESMLTKAQQKHALIVEQSSYVYIKWLEFYIKELASEGKRSVVLLYPEFQNWPEFQNGGFKNLDKEAFKELNKENLIFIDTIMRSYTIVVLESDAKLDWISRQCNHGYCFYTLIDEAIDKVNDHFISLDYKIIKFKNKTMDGVVISWGDDKYDENLRSGLRALEAMP